MEPDGLTRTHRLDGDGETSHDFCYVANVVQANLLAATAEAGATGRVYNVAFGERTTLNALHAALRDGLAALDPALLTDAARLPPARVEPLDRITVKPDVCLGQPTIRGLRITVGVVLKMLASGASVAEVLAAYPELEEEDVRQAMRYAAWAVSDQLRSASAP